MTAVPERYRYAVIAHVFVDPAEEAIVFYRRAFGATELFRIASPEGKIIHSEIRIGRSVVMVGDPDDGGLFVDPRRSGGCSVGLHVYVDDVRAIFSSATAAGAEVIQELQEMFYGARTAMVRDPFGHIWVLLEQTEELAEAEIERRAQALFAQ